VVAGFQVSIDGRFWVSTEDEVELASLRRRIELLDFVAQRVLTMSPAERRQFDVLMAGSQPRNR
jgi:hypothetical protein